MRTSPRAWSPSSPRRPWPRTRTRATTSSTPSSTKSTLRPARPSRRTKRRYSSLNPPRCGDHRLGRGRRHPAAARPQPEWQALDSMNAAPSDTLASNDFPDGFLWGAATSAHQVEGGNLNNDWWAFEQRPDSAAVESSADGIDHYHRYADDFELLASLGHNAHRLSLEWSRIEPAPGQFSRAAVAHYRRVLSRLADTGLTAMVTLHHFTLPQWYASQGGWLAP